MCACFLFGCVFEAYILFNLSHFRAAACCRRQNFSTCQRDANAALTRLHTHSVTLLLPLTQPWPCSHMTERPVFPKVGPGFYSAEWLEGVLGWSFSRLFSLFLIWTGNKCSVVKSAALLPQMTAFTWTFSILTIIPVLTIFGVWCLHLHRGTWVSKSLYTW